MEATALRTTRAPTDCGENVPSNVIVTACPILSATPHSARRPLAEMSTRVALNPGGEMRRPLIDGTADAGRRAAAEWPASRGGAGRAAAGGAVPGGRGEGTV